MSNTNIVVGGCRIPITYNITDNLSEIKKAIDWAAVNDVDIMSTPECALSGYLWNPTSQEDLRVLEISDAISEIQRYSQEKNVDLILGTAWYDENWQWTNMQAFIVDGKCVHVHRKNILFDAEKQFYINGTQVEIIKYNNFKIAGLICNDLWSNPIYFTDSSKLLERLYNAEIDILFVSANVPSNCTHPDLFYQWHDSCIRMIGGTGKWYTVVSDKTQTIKICPSGVVHRNSMWVQTADDFETSYFKETCY